MVRVAMKAKPLITTGMVVVLTVLAMLLGNARPAGAATAPARKDTFMEIGAKSVAPGSMVYTSGFGENQKMSNKELRDFALVVYQQNVAIDYMLNAKASAKTGRPTQLDCILNPSSCLPSVGDITDAITQPIVDFFNNTLLPAITRVISDTIKKVFEFLTNQLDVLWQWMAKGLAEVTAWVFKNVFFLATGIRGDGKGLLFGAVDINGNSQAVGHKGVRGVFGSQSFVKIYTRVAVVSIWLLLPVFVLAAIQALMKLSFKDLIQPILLLPFAFIGGLAVLTITAYVYIGANGFSQYLAGSVSGDIDQFSKGIGGALAAFIISNPIGGAFSFLVMIFIFLFAISAGFAVWLVFLTRDMVVLLAALFIPMGLAAVVWPATARWFFRLIKLLFGMILAKPVMVACLALGISLMAGPHATIVPAANVSPDSSVALVGAGGTQLMGGMAIAPVGTESTQFQVVSNSRVLAASGGRGAQFAAQVQQPAVPAETDLQGGQTFRQLMLGAGIFMLAAFAPFAVIKIIGAFADEALDGAGMDGFLKQKGAAVAQAPAKHRAKQATRGQMKSYRSPGNPFERSGRMWNNMLGGGKEGSMKQGLLNRKVSVGAQEQYNAEKESGGPRKYAEEQARKK